MERKCFLFELFKGVPRVSIRAVSWGFPPKWTSFPSFGSSLTWFVLQVLRCDRGGPSGFNQLLLFFNVGGGFPTAHHRSLHPKTALLSWKNQEDYIIIFTFVHIFVVFTMNKKQHKKKSENKKWGWFSVFAFTLTRTAVFWCKDSSKG